jgi:two-component system sensor histidine kinase SenX3
VRILADREALTLALRNLLDNAVKYSPSHSTVTASVEQHGSRVRIGVEDRGAGIPRPEQRAVLRKFARGSSAQQMNVKGTGIGLTMTERIVRAHHGRLELRSEAGHGSTFTIVLPMAVEPS